MASTVARFFRRTLSLGRLRLPAWMVGAALPVGLLAIGMAVTLASSGQAVGPVLSGSITGSAGVTAQQALVISACDITSHGGADDALCDVAAQGVSFTAAIEIHRHDKAVIALGINNTSQADVNATIELSVPTGFDVEMEDSDNASTKLREAQMARSTWLLFVGTANTEKLNITLRPRPDLVPGFYTISARIAEIVG